jgi:acyl-CoA dehydrogenase family protein 9
MKFDSFLENLYFGKFGNPGVYSESSTEDPEVESEVRKYEEATKEFPPAELEKLGRVPPELLKKLGEIGFFGLTISKEYGGVGLNLRQYLAVIRELVRFDMAVSIVSIAHLSIGMKAIELFGSGEQKKKYLPRAASGSMIFCFALTEPLIGSDARNINTTAELSGDGKYYILNGTKTYITNANYSGGLTVFAQTDKNKKGKLGAFIVETAWKGVSIGPDMEKMGLHASSTAAIFFKDVVVPAGNLIGGPGDGFKIAMTVLDYGRLALGASSAGALEASYHDMLNRSISRIQFEKPIIDYELIQEKIARAFMEKEAVWAMTNFTAGLLENNPTAYVATETSHCKLYGTNRAWESLYDAMQTAGGSGYLKTQPYEKRIRDSRVATIFEGTTEIHSIYPPLSLLRNIARNKPAFIDLAMLRFAPSRWSSADPDFTVSKSLVRVKSYALAYRKLFMSGMMKYGKKMPEMEYLLRRLTGISVILFAMLSMVLKIRSLRARGRPYSDTIMALRYFLYTSAKSVKENNRLLPDKGEKLFHEFINEAIKTRF